jgi:hypothetical protein
MSFTHSAPPRQRRWFRAGAIVGGLLVVYTALGFLAAPPLLRSLLVKEASAALHRDVAIAKVRVNPLALSVTIEGLAVAHRDGAPFLGWDSLYLRLAPLRLFTGDLGLSEIRLVRPSLHVGLGADGALTFQDLLTPEEGAAAPAPAEKQGGLGVWIGELAVEEAQVAFRDATRRPVFDTAIGPITFRLASFRTKGGGDSPYAFTGTTDAGETLRWTGTLSTQPFRSAGTLGFERIALPRYAAYLQDELPADLRSGLLDFETQYELEWGAARRVVKLMGGKVTVDALAMGPRGSTDLPIELPRLEVTGIDVDALLRDAKVGAVTVRGGALRVRREADGTLELAKMAPLPSETPPWTWSVDALAISGVALGWEDRAAPRPVALPLTELGVRLEKLRSEPGAVSPLSVSLAWNGSGRIAVTGSVEPLGGKGTLEVDASELDLAPLEPYLAETLAARLTGGRAGAKVKLGFDVSGAEPRWTFAGDVRLDALAIAERGNDDLLRWRALEVSGIDAASTPPRASVRLVRLVEPRAKIYVWEDGATSLARALPAAPGTPAAAAQARPAAPAPEWRTAIGAVEVVRGRAAFVDRSVAPPAVVNVTGADAKVTRLSSDPKVRSSVDVRLQIEGASPVRIAGTLNPLQKEAYTELTVASSGVDLSPLGPYSGKFLGYGIQKGKLDLDLRYKVQNRMLAATNVVRVNQFTLGETVDSPDATKVPVRLALALLQDRDGVILLDVPVEGNLDDPEFRLGRVIWRTVLNVLVKVATSPFSALAALAGGGDDADLSMVEFAPGSAEPLPAAQERFALLAKSLGQRPALGLELEGAADEAQDGAVLRRAALERRLRSAKAATLRPPPASLDGVTLSPDERARFVRAAYEAAFPAPGAPPKGEAAPPPPTPAQMEERLADATEVPADAYRSLAAERAQHAREALVAAGLDQARLFLSQGGTRAANEQGPRVYFTVK